MKVSLCGELQVCLHGAHCIMHQPWLLASHLKLVQDECVVCACGCGFLGLHAAVAALTSKDVARPPAGDTY